MADNILEIRHLSKSFGTHEVLRDIDFDVKKGDVISIIGASGSGKSTLLRCVNLLETPTSGDILYHGENVTGKSVNAAKYRSHVGNTGGGVSYWNTCRFCTFFRVQFEMSFLRYSA